MRISEKAQAQSIFLEYYSKVIGIPTPALHKEIMHNLHPDDSNVRAAKACALYCIDEIINALTCTGLKETESAVRKEILRCKKIRIKVLIMFVK